MPTQSMLGDYVQAEILVDGGGWVGVTGKPSHLVNYILSGFSLEDQGHYK